MSDPVPFGLAIDEYATASQHLGERHPVIRTGAREPIPSNVRGLVYGRDGGLCRYCGSSYPITVMQLDHIVPWSAGGSDHSTNLRLLCPPCNERRSNYHDLSEESPPLPVTHRCISCWARRYGEPDSEYEHHFDTSETIIAWCASCRQASRTTERETC